MLRTVGHQASLLVGFPRQEYWSELPFPSPGDLPDQGIQTQGGGGCYTYALRKGAPPPPPWPFSFSPPSAACTPTMCTLGLPDNPLTDEEAAAQGGTVLFPRPHSKRANRSSGHPTLHLGPRCLFSSLIVSSSLCCIFPLLLPPLPFLFSLPVLSLEVS